MKKLLMVLAASCGLIAGGGTYTWTGSVSSDFNTGGNWSGGTAPTSSDSDINLVFPNRNSTVSGLGALTIKTIVLQGGTTELQFGANASAQRVTVSGVISGPGALKVTGNAAGVCYFRLNGANTFSGGYYQNGGRVEVCHNQSFGTGPVKARCNGKPGYSINFMGATVVANDISVGNEAQAAIGTVNVQNAVRLTGTFTYAGGDCAPTVSANANCRFGGSGRLTLAGPVVSQVSGSWIHNAGEIIVEQAITGNMSPFSFNGGTLLELKASGNTMKGSVGWNNWSGSASTLRISADNVFAGPTVVSSGRADGVKTLDLNGHNLSLQGYYSGGRVDPVATSASAATLTITGDTANRTYGGSFTGAMSLVYDCTGRTYTLTNSTSTMTGRLEVRAGTVVVTERAAFPNLAAVAVADGATLRFTSTAGTLATRLLAVGTSGTLDLGGKSLEVKMLTVGGEVMPAGVYAAADHAWLTGSGSSVTVSNNGYDPTWWVWTGDAGGEWNVPGNWMKNGAVCTTAPGASDVLCLDGAGAGNPFLVTTTTEIPNPIVLGDGLQVFSTGASSAVLTLRGVVSGAGGISFQGTGNQSVLRLPVANTFTGGVCRAGAGQVQLWNMGGLGTGAFSVMNPSGIPAATPMSFRVSGTVTNDMTFLAEGQNNDWVGAIGVSTETVHLTGAVTFAGDTRVALNAGSKLYFDGETTVNGRLTLNSYNSDVYFTTAVKSTTGNGYLHTDQGRGTWHLAQSGNALKIVYMSGNNFDARIVCGAEQVFPQTAYIQYNVSGQHAYVLDLGGYDQTFAYLYDSSTGPAAHTVTSATAATLTLKPAADYLCRMVLTGEVSLDLQATAGKTYTLSEANHTTRGAFTVTSGTLKLANGATASMLSAIEVASGAKLQLDGTAGIVAAGRLTVASGGVVEAASGQTLTVDCAVVAGTGVAAGTYTRANCGWVTGEGAVRVVVNGDDGLYVWTGAAGGEWNVAGNWSVDGAVATAAPTADKTLYIGAATPQHPFLVTGGVEIANPIVLGAGQQYMLLGFGDGVLHLSGQITGSGGIQFDSQNNAQYYARLSGAENDFVGGVRRSGAGQLQVFHGHALGVGLVTLDDGSVMNSGIANRTPLYVGQSCTIANEFLIGGESFVSWNGWWGGKAGETVRFTGRVRFIPGGNNFETRFAATSTIHFDGPVVLGGDSDMTRLICKWNATAYFHQAIQAEGVPRQIFADNEGFTGYLCASSNRISELRGCAISDWKWYLQAPDALATAGACLDGEPTGSGFLLDLGGYDQRLVNLYYTGAYSDKFRVTSATPAVLTVASTQDRCFGGRIENPVSLTYSPAGDYLYKLTNAVHSTTGAITVTRGTLKLVCGASFAAARKAEVRGGTLQLTEAGALGPRLELRLNGGTLQLDAGTTTVANLYFGDSATKQEGGLWGAVGNTAAKHHDSRITGNGLLNVLRFSGATMVIFR